MGAVTGTAATAARKMAKKFKFNYCTKCVCRDDKARPKCKGKKNCGFRKFVGDDRCDDANNNCGCNWDEGDCCGKNGDKYQFEYCLDCKCQNPQLENDCKGICNSPNYKGDGNCDDENNNCGCDYDGGDCCGKSKSPHQFAYCSKCECLEPSTTTTKH